MDVVDREHSNVWLTAISKLLYNFAANYSYAIEKTHYV